MDKTEEFNETLTEEQKQTIEDAKLCYQVIEKCRDEGKMTSGCFIELTCAAEQYCKERGVCYRDAYLGRYDDE